MASTNKKCNRCVDKIGGSRVKKLEKILETSVGEWAENEVISQDVPYEGSKRFQFHLTRFFPFRL